MRQLCSTLHDQTRAGTRFRFPFDERDIPKNGIYLLFQRGESGHDGDRIVRVGTHTGQNQLRSRLKQHFLREKKDRSIFRKNVGRCLLNRNNDPYLKIWEIDCTTTANRSKYGHLMDPRYQAEIESQISRYIQDTFSFCVIEVPLKNERLYLEARLISTLSLCNQCQPSAHWLGSYSPKVKIRESGLWQVNELYKQSLAPEDLSVVGERII